MSKKRIIKNNNVKKEVIIKPLFHINETKSEFNPDNTRIKKRINSWRMLTDEHTQATLKFARDMFARGYNRSERLGGSVDRNKVEKMSDNIQGKLAEFGFYEYCLNNGMEATIPNCDVLPKGEWDDGDFFINGKNVSIKSAMLRSQMVLMECEAYTPDGYELNFRPPKKVDFVVLCRVALSVTEFSQKLSIFEFMKEHGDVLNLTGWVDICGYITHRDFCYLSSNGFIKKKGEPIIEGHPVTMDADNYWVSAGDMRRINDILDDLK